MKIILLKDISTVGKKWESKDVSDGYARNFLLKNKLAMLATEGNIRQLEEQAKSKKAQRERAKGDFHALRAAWMERGIVIKKKANETPQKEAGQEVSLYAAVSQKEILEALHALHFPVPGTLEEKSITIEKPIKTAGSHEATLAMGGEKITLKIEVKGEN